MDKNHYAALQAECDKLVAEALVLAELDRILDGAIELIGSSPAPVGT